MSNFKVDGINTNELRRLTKKETEELFKRYKEGDQQAKEILVEANIKLVLSIIKKYSSSKYDINDLFQVGCVGLIKAIENFDVSLGLMLSTYACPLILGEVKRYMRDSNSIRITRSIRDLTYKLMKYKECYASLYGHEPTRDEIKKELGIDDFELREALDSLKEPMSIYDPIYNDGGDTIYLLDQLKDEKLNTYNKEELIALKEALKTLKDRERKIIIDRYLIGMTQMELAASYGVSQAQISRVEKSAINNIRKLIK